MTEQNKKLKPSRKPNVWLEFLGSMNLAITLLVMLAIASVIGTVLQQYQPVQDYIIKFGPFWYEVYRSLALYDVYGAAWFMIVLLFLLISTGVCVTRNTPIFIKDMKEYSEKLSINALKHQPNHTQFAVAGDFEQQKAYASEFLKHEGFKTRINQRDDGSVTVAGLKGHWNRLGYFFSHISIIIICIGALMDSNIYLKYFELTGSLQAETRNVPLSEVDKRAWLPPSNFSYRGSVNITEGRDADVVFLPWNEGYLVQQLPFRIEVKAFRVDYYDNGMPRTYASDLVLFSDDLDEPIEKTIEVNHPLYYKNYAIYQSSYGDGGSLVNFNVYALASPMVSTTVVESAINRHESLTTPAGRFRVEFNDFKLHNIVPLSEEDALATGRKVKNNGPSVLFRVRNEEGRAWEYENYMIPDLQEGRWFYMSGIRTTVADDFRYLFIPADDLRTKKRFFEFLALINNAPKADRIYRQAMPKPIEMERANYEIHMQLMQQLVKLFRETGFDGISHFIQTNVPQDQQEEVAAFYFGQLANSLQTLYLHVLEQEGVEINEQGDISETHQVWFEDAITAIGSLNRYGPAMFFEMTSFDQRWSTGLQITKSPGKNVVYFGSALLTLGIFFMFYVRQRRVWIHLKRNGEQTDITIAGRDNRKLPETDEEFEKLVTNFRA
ncbi:cytochrome c biogenesis protein ResB [Thiomicrospira sp. R3]|uniref:cytochrome c biogenesis protein ResB n=1 Tax=Thiomicrospira sp. R3 TaxID=3035472 RepID=UPI00259AF1AB|nr:cytochrome c biogenesis protein ResB [Thiomicrospira sp. R3]WFE69584.1 cytochrome c biogenesis protein ResB [Thiomicrospira sp. R3]